MNIESAQPVNCYKLKNEATALPPFSLGTRFPTNFI